MNSLRRIAWTFFVGVLAVSTSLALPAAGQMVNSDTTSGGQLVITPKVNGSKKPPQLQQSNVSVLLKGHPAEITNWESGSNVPLELVFLIDNSVPSSISLRFSEIRKFMDGLPPSAQVGVAYMMNGQAQFAQTLTTNHQMAGKALHLPIPVPGISASPYFCLSDLAKHWPSHAQARRLVLMISSGQDPYYRSPDLQDPYLGAAISDSQKAGLLVYSIYYPNRGQRFGGGRQTLFGQNYLQRLADETGAQTFSGSMIAPVSLDPMLAELKNVTENQYVVGIAAQGKGLQLVKVKSNLPGVKISAPSAVMVGALR